MGEATFDSLISFGLLDEVMRKTREKEAAARRAPESYVRSYCTLTLSGTC